jgi:L-ascorbate metabolism protein UlaG (beta-lactamase superfamily)
MKITFVGLSSYLIEDKHRGRLLIDLFKDAPEHSLGLTVPEHLLADIFLVSHADSDHSNLEEHFAEHKQDSRKQDKLNINIFPDLNLRGTLVKEWNGDLCIAYHFTVDGFRCLHLADNSHSLTEKQLKEIGKVDILFLPMSKSKTDVVKLELELIKRIKPKVIIPSHIIPMPLKEIRKGYGFVSKKLSKVILPAKKDPHANLYTVDIFSYMLLAIENLSKHFEVKEIPGFEVEIKKLPKTPMIYYFSKCQAKYKTKK